MFVSSYFGRDVFSFNSADAGFGASIPWGNAMVSSRWNHVVNDKVFLNVNRLTPTMNSPLGRARTILSLALNLAWWTGPKKHS